VKQFFGYIRVSTAKQGEHGVSLQEQKDAIVRHCQRLGLDITAWFEERETAAKRGRPVFTRMLKDLRAGKARGVVIHKIDRSARNLRDWADLGELIDRGIEVQFANESLDLHSRGGRLSADIQAVVAADYIRNLREETKKGFYGRIKQGLYPLPAPMGYLDTGKGKPKEIDPVRGRLIRKAFELYATGRYNLDSLADEMFSLGLRNRRGSKVTRTTLSDLLNNPFYIGLIRLSRTGETFPGAHQPLISKNLFDRVQRALKGKLNTKAQIHDYLFRRMVRCKQCGCVIVGERQKGRIYYRCHTKTCKGVCIREKDIEDTILQNLLLLQFGEAEKAYIRERVVSLKRDWKQEEKELASAVSLQMSALKDRLNRLTDAFLDEVIDKQTFETRKAALLMQQKDLEEKLVLLQQKSQSVPDRLSEFLELAGGAYLQYKFALPEQKRDLVKITSSNCQVEGKKLDITLSFPFSEVANRFKNTNGGPYRNILRTWDVILPQLTEFLIANSTAERLTLAEL
jgi:site-specific DNA recombinase